MKKVSSWPWRSCTAVLLTFLLLLSIIPSNSMIYANNQGHAAGQAKPEMRAAWISTVYNIDWPSKPGLSVDKQKLEFSTMLDSLKGMGIHTVFVQVRGASDAIYPSTIVPWSASLTGTEGKHPGYDPLAYMITEAHNRDMEIHAWFNPFRAGTTADMNRLADNHPAKAHPEWIVRHGNLMYFNPGIPEARQHIIDAIMEVVNQYDVDGVHLDDYFYPYGNTPFADEHTFSSQQGSSSSLADWRRGNINSFVSGLHQAIKSNNKKLPFGISPFGIWRNAKDDPTGSDTNGTSAYDNQYADARTWIVNGWVDYIVPQLYWSIGFKAADYSKLVAWWANETAGTGVDLYIGQAAYKLGTNQTDWSSSEQIIQQLELNRTYSEVKGSLFFSAKILMANTAGIADRLALYYAGDKGEAPAPVPAPPIDAQTAIVNASVLNIRSGAGLHFPVIHKASMGTKVSLLARESEWYRIQLANGQIGWAHADYLRLETGPSGGNNQSGQDLRFKLDGVFVHFPDAKPFIDKNQRTQVPIRFIAEAMAFGVEWGQNGQQQYVSLTKPQLQVLINIGENIAIVNGQQVMMDTVATKQAGRSFVPLRFLAELNGMDIEWEADSRTVTLADKKAS